MRVWTPLLVIGVAAACGDNIRGNRLPTVEQFSLVTLEDVPVTRTVNAQDFDLGDVLSAAIPIPPEHGNAVASGLAITYTPDPDYHGPDQFAVTVTDGTDEVSLTIDVTVESVPDVPIGGEDALATNEDTPRTVPIELLLANDTDNDGDALSLTSVGQPINGIVSVNNGMVTFTPNTNFNGGGSFIYTITDGLFTTPVLVNVIVGAANDAPDAVDDFVTTAEDVPITVQGTTLLANDSDPEGQILTIDDVSNPVNGTVVLNGGNPTFTPNGGFSGDASFDYTITDGIASDTATVHVTVTLVNTPPNAVNDLVTQTGAANAIPHAQLLGNDDAGGDGGPLTITAVGNVSNGDGTVSLEATTVTFTPNNGFVGVVTFDYTISDGFDTDTATVTVTVTTPRICGDGTIELPEECDDDDTDPLDGCSATCTIEPGFDCTGEPSVCAPICGDGVAVGNEPCDDDNADEFDGCTSLCVLARVCDATEFPGGDRFAVDITNGHCYVGFDGTTTTFAAAQASCVAQRGYLATVTSAGEQTLVASVQNSAERPWIGAVDDSNDNDAIFDWVTNEAFGFTNFATNQPDDDAGNGNQGECLHLLDATGQWNDTNCNDTTFVIGQICEFHAAACGDSLINATGEECDDGNNVGGDGCSAACQIEELFFSEYVEGTGSNKALEIRNLRNASVPLSGCIIRTDFGGGGQATFSLPPLNSIPGNDVVVICNGLIDPTVLLGCDIVDAAVGGAMSFDGNDTVSLLCNGVVLDVIGDVGFDPAPEWGTGLRSTADHTLRRRCDIVHGDVSETDDFEPTLAAEWEGFAIDTFSGLGDTACAP